MATDPQVVHEHHRPPALAETDEDIPQFNA